MPDPAAGGAAGGDASLLGSGGSTPADWRATLPEEIRNSPSLTKFKDPVSLAKSYLEAEKLIGVDKMPAPTDKWSEAEWSQLYDRLGRPKTADDYKDPEVKLKESIKLDPAAIKEAKQTFHKLGLTEKQSKEILGHYFSTLNKQAEQFETQTAASRNDAVAELKKVWGSNFELNLERAKAVAQQVGGQEFVEFLAESPLGNNTQLAVFLAKIAEKIGEDSTGSGGKGLELSTTSNAMAEIERLKADQAYMKQYFNRNEPGHEAAVKRMTELFKIAYPGKQSSDM